MKDSSALRHVVASPAFGVDHARHAEPLPGHFVDHVPHGRVEGHAGTGVSAVHQAFDPRELLPELAARMQVREVLRAKALGHEQRHRQGVAHRERGRRRRRRRQVERAGLARDGHVATVTVNRPDKLNALSSAVISELIANPNSRALYIFPTKALAQGGEYFGGKRMRPA